MDVCRRDLSVSGESEQEHVLSTTTLDDLFSSQNTVSSSLLFPFCSEISGFFSCFLAILQKGFFLLHLRCLINCQVCIFNILATHYTLFPSPVCMTLKPSLFFFLIVTLFALQEVDVGLEWLSVFVEDCFSSPASCLLAPPSDVQISSTKNSKPSSNIQLQRSQLQKQCPLQNFVVPGKARSKRKRLSAPRTRDPLSIWSHQLNLNPQNEALISDPPLLKQAYWLADSELMVPRKEENKQIVTKEEEEEKEEVEMKEKGSLRRKKENLERLVMSESEEEESSMMQNPIMPRRCSHCLAQRTPQWRAGPLGPKTLCNACGVRYKSGRLLPEYRPAKSPTFVSYLHSNSHKKVMEMRMAPVSSIPSEHH